MLTEQKRFGGANSFLLIGKKVSARRFKQGSKSRC